MIGDDVAMMTLMGGDSRLLAMQLLRVMKNWVILTQDEKVASLVVYAVVGILVAVGDG